MKKTNFRSMRRIILKVRWHKILESQVQHILLPGAKKNLSIRANIKALCRRNL